MQVSTVLNGEPGLDGGGCVAAISSSGQILTRVDLAVYGDALDFAEPTTDATGNVFLTYNPGRYNGVLTLVPHVDGFETIEWDDGSGPNYASTSHVYYYAELEGPGGRWAVHDSPVRQRLQPPQLRCGHHHRPDPSLGRTRILVTNALMSKNVASPSSAGASRRQGTLSADSPLEDTRGAPPDPPRCVTVGLVVERGIPVTGTCRRPVPPNPPRPVPPRDTAFYRPTAGS